MSLNENETPSAAPLEEARENPAALKEQGEGPASAVLAVRAAGALVRWGQAGFRRVDAETFESRRSACLQCPHLRSPGNQLAYKVMADPVKRVCGLCGCCVERKARLRTEECPAPHPSEPALTRWGEART
jgi:hypothetical protein